LASIAACGAAQPHIVCHSGQLRQHQHRLPLTNLIQHQRIKHIEIDLHFVHEHVVVWDVRILHVLMTSQFTDIFTRGLSSSVFSEFQFNLNICSG
jgi:hypothetical protein